MRCSRSLLLPAALLLAQASAAASRPDCEQARRSNHWCKAANVGFVAGLEIDSRFLFEVLDPHGHTIVAKEVRCEVCRRALATDGFCPAHRMGYVGGKAYMTPLTYYLAKGRPLDPAALTCPICRKHTQSIGWCEKDRRGIVGTTAFTDRGDFDDLAKYYDLLQAAIRLSATCERCSGAMMADGYCAIHRVKYKDGKPVAGFGEPGSRGGR